MSHRRATLVEPIELLLSEEEDTAKHNLGDSIGILLRIREGKRRSLGSTKHLPPINTKVLADLLDVGDEGPRDVRLERCIGRALAAATLIEIHNPVFLWVAEATLFRIGAAPGTTVEKYHRLPGRVARL